MFPDSTFQNLDHGLYWFGYGDSWQKAIPGQTNAYYVASKPTLIYIHGWQNGSSLAKNRETFNRKDAGATAAAFTATAQASQSAICSSIAIKPTWPATPAAISASPVTRWATNWPSY